jgi:hypothetical protein
MAILWYRKLWLQKYSDPILRCEILSDRSKAPQNCLKCENISGIWPFGPDFGLPNRVQKLAKPREHFHTVRSGLLKKRGEIGAKFGSGEFLSVKNSSKFRVPILGLKFLKNKISHPKIVPTLKIYRTEHLIRIAQNITYRTQKFALRIRCLNKLRIRPLVYIL